MKRSVPVNIITETMLTTFLIFTQGKKTITEYATPMGGILIGLDTSKVEVAEETQDKLRIHIDYTLEANYQYIADCHIEVVVTANSDK